MTTDWQNWSGSQIHNVKEKRQPHSEDELAEILHQSKKAGHTVRTIGSAHSFVPFWTDDTLISLDNMKGLIDCDPKNRLATFWAGSKLHEIGDVLWDAGLAMENMGDIDRQSIAGAVSTGTHGTGQGLRNISSQIDSLHLLKANGEMHAVLDDGSEEGLLDAARVSFGSLGIITRLTLRLIPAYYLHEKNWSLSVEECGESLETLIAENRHLEFFWEPQSDLCQMKSLNITSRNEEIKINESESIGRSYRVFPSNRDFRFNETEFTLPADQGWQCFMEIRDLIQQKHPHVRWPLEYRTLKADSALLSSTAQKDSVTISAHEGSKREYQNYFSDVESVFRRFSARPHWGKIHQHEFSDFQKLMPQFQRFCDIRNQFDPEGRFLNPFLKRIFGID